MKQKGGFLKENKMPYKSRTKRLECSRRYYQGHKEQHGIYAKPLLINTLCKECHTIQHIKNFQQSKFGGGI